MVYGVGLRKLLMIRLSESAYYIRFLTETLMLLRYHSYLIGGVNANNPTCRFNESCTRKTEPFVCRGDGEISDLPWFQKRSVIGHEIDSTGAYIFQIPKVYAGNFLVFG